MHSREEKLKVGELLIKYDKSPASVIRELRHPCRTTLHAWHEEHLTNECRMSSTSAHRRYTEERCNRCGITRSMSKKDCSPDNSAMEGFFGRLKVDFFHGRD